MYRKMPYSTMPVITTTITCTYIIRRILLLESCVVEKNLLLQLYNKLRDYDIAVSSNKDICLVCS